jgi:hypothetical protein
MPLNYQFFNNVTDDVRQEIARRQAAYWPDNAVSDNALAWNYQKTSYLILTSFAPEEVKPSVPGAGEGPSSAGYTAGTAKASAATWRQDLPAPIPKPNKEIIIQSKRTAIQNPTAPILDLYKENGTIAGAVLNSAEVTADGTVGKYGSILRISVNFTVFDRYELDSYMDNFLRPGRDIGLEFGWSVNENFNVNRGKIHGTVFNFSFSAKEDGSWECTLQAYGASAMTYGFGVDAKDSNLENGNGVDTTNFATYGLLDIIQRSIDNASKLFDSPNVTRIVSYCKKADISKVISTGVTLAPAKPTTTENRSNRAPFDNNFNIVKVQDTGINIYFYKLPSSYFPAFNGNKDLITDFSIIPYISLDNLIKLINAKINKISKRGLPNYIFQKDGEDVCVGNNYNTIFLQTGPADSSKFGFTTQRNGDGKQSILSLGGTGEPGDFSNSNNGAIIPLQHLVLINAMFIKDELQKIISSDKNVQNKKITSFLNVLFDQLSTETGGVINLVLEPDRDKDGNHDNIFILNKNGTPKNVLDNITVFSIPMMTKGSVVRAMSIESKVPDAIVTEVATFTRAGQSYGENEFSLAKASATKQELIKQLIDLNKSYIYNLEGTSEETTNNLNQWRNKVRDIYVRLYSIQENLTLNTDGTVGGINNIMDLKTAVFPIYLKLTLDGINGFLYGNAVTTNWLPKQYRDSRIYWTVIKIRHLIQNNDWTTELEAIYRVKEK